MYIDKFRICLIIIYVSFFIKRNKFKRIPLVTLFSVKGHYSIIVICNHRLYTVYIFCRNRILHIPQITNSPSLLPLGRASKHQSGKKERKYVGA